MGAWLSGPAPRPTEPPVVRHPRAILDKFDKTLVRFGGATVFPELGSPSLLARTILSPELAEANATDVFKFETSRRPGNVLRGRRYFSQFAEDCRMRAFLQFAGLEPDVAGGKIFLEMGALNGVGYSNTLGFEQTGWRGVLIEANPDNCKALTRARRSGRGVNLCAGICEAGAGPMEFEKIKSATSRMVGFEPLPPNATLLERQRRVQVPCLPLGAVLQDLAVPHLTYFSLDVEGAELAVLRTYDWSVHIDVIEWENSKKADFRAIAALLRAHGMEAIGKNKHDQVWASAAVRDRLHEKGTRSFEAAVGHQGRNDPAFDCTFEPGAYRG